MFKKLNYALFGLLAIFLLNSCRVENPEITTKEINDHIKYLASESLKGRYPGTEESNTAAKYLKYNFVEGGLELIGDKGFQKFEVVTAITAGEDNYLKFGENIGTLNVDFAPFAYTKNTSLETEVVFVGYGFVIETDSLQWDDYANIDVEGKWALILMGDPETDDMNSPFAKYAGERDKLITAKDNGALGVLFVNGPVFDKSDKLIGLNFDKTLSNAGIAVINIKRAFADLILQDVTIEELEKEINDEHNSVSFLSGKTLEATTDVNQLKVETKNIVAFLEGNELKDEFIVLGAHWDHLGLGGPNSGSRVPDTTAVHYGADDNASGVAGIIEIAEKLSQQKDLKRSVLIIAFGAEEMGLLGSSYFTNNPLFELNQLKAMVNLDMIGRLKDDNSIMISGTGTSAKGEALLSSLNADSIFAISMQPEGFGASDHASFYAKDIPVFFLSSGAHDDYHTPFDSPERINLEGAKSISDYTYELMLNLISREENLTFQEAGPKKRASGSRRFKVTFGIMPNFTSTENNGLGVDGVSKGGPAEAAGMKKGDRIVAINGLPVTNIYEYMSRLSKLEAGTMVTVDVIRNEEKVVLLLNL
ncbi:MAG: M20/M25/M40 family metallo-hydrolase [Bacteroidales bacterium]|jgi:aminopeptidase YwaD|nr:M20/M25/M40 family metallo-hydrolase [Bacteroidales bacterium]